MTPSDVSKLIYKIEHDFPVSSWKINGIDIWPILRVRIQTKINFYQNDKFTRKSSAYGGYFKYNFFKKVTSIFSSFLKINKLKKVDFIGTSNFSHRSIYNNEYYNKFYDPILDRVNNNGIIIEHNSKDFYENYPLHNTKKVLFFEDLFYYQYFISSVLKKLKLFSPLKKIELNKYGDFLQLLTQFEGLNNLNQEFTLKKMESLVLNVLIYKKVYSKIFRKTKPKYTFQICHYNVNSLAVSLASRSMEIPSVEIQHGGQPKVHMAYSNWTKVPDLGYNTLPKIFWNWDEESKENLDQWTSKNNYHKALVLGNPWIDYFKFQLDNEKKKIILYSLQPINFELIFPSYLINFIKKNPEYKWWFRIHPTDVNRKDEYLTFFKENQIDKLIIFDDGSKLSLPESLKQAKLHITYNSGTLMEAAEYGVKTIILDTKNAKTYFGSQIKKEAAFVVNQNFDALFKQVVSLKTTDKKSEIDFTSCFEELRILENRLIFQ